MSVHDYARWVGFQMINSQRLPGVLSFSQARDLEQAMASDNPSNMEVQQESEFNLFHVGTEAQYELFKWIFGVMAQGKNLNIWKVALHDIIYDIM